MNSAKKVMNQQKDNSEKKENVTVKAATGKKKLGVSSGRNVKAIVLSAICIALVLVLCIGVGIQQLGPEVAFTVNGTKVTMDDMMYPIYEKESYYLPYDEMYQAYMGTSVWESSYQGSDSNVPSSVSNKIGIKQEILDNEEEYVVLYKEAVKAGYKLTSAEEKKAESQAKKAMKGLSWVQKFRLSMSKKRLTKRFEKTILADRYKSDRQKELNKKVDETSVIKKISKKDYREYDIQYYAVALSKTDSSGNTKKVSAKKKQEYKTEINKYAKKAAKAKDFTKLIGSKDKTDVKYDKAEFTEKAGWSYLSTANLKKVKAMKNGTVSPAFYDEKAGYYVFVKMIDNNSTSSYQKACDDAVKSAQTEKYTEWLNKLKESYKIKVNASVWNNVEIGSMTTEIVTAEDLQKMNESSSKKSSSKKSSSKSSSKKSTSKSSGSSKSSK